MATNHDILERGHVAEQANILECTGDAALSRLMRRIGEQGFAIKDKTAAVGNVETGQTIKEGRKYA